MSNDSILTPTQLTPAAVEMLKVFPKNYYVDDRTHEFDSIDQRVAFTVLKTSGAIIAVDILQRTYNVSLAGKALLYVTLNNLM